MKRLIAAGTLLVVFGLAEAARAQSNAAEQDASTTPPDEHDIASLPVAAPALAVETTTANAPTAKPTIAGLELPFRLYGFIDPRGVVASHAVASFSQNNASAITGAANPLLATRPVGDARLSFQIQQSRFGLILGEKKPVRGQLEVDFIDGTFAKSSPTTQALPRLRIAKVELDACDKHLLIIAGQDWDLYQPVNHPGLNLVGGAFTAGNTGFMRHQLKAIWTSSGLEVGAAIGLQAANAGASDNAVELSRMPTFAVRVAFLPNPTSKVGVSGVVSGLRWNAGAPATTAGAAADHRSLAGSAGIFGDLTLSSWTNLRFEGYVGQNAQNLGVLSLSQGSAAHDVSELGGFVAIRQAAASDHHFVYGYAGIAHVMNDGAMSYGYSRSADGAIAQTPGVFGIRQNITAHLGYELRPYDNLAFMVEGFWLRTHHKLYAADVDVGAHGDAKAAGAEIGMMYTF